MLSYLVFEHLVSIKYTLINCLQHFSSFYTIFEQSCSHGNKIRKIETGGTVGNIFINMFMLD